MDMEKYRAVMREEHMACVRQGCYLLARKTLRKIIKWRSPQSIREASRWYYRVTRWGLSCGKLD